MTKVHYTRIPLSLRETGDCFNCIARLKDDIQRLKGVKKVEDTEDTSKMVIEYDPNFTSLDLIESYVIRQGLKLKTHYGHERYNVEGLDCPDCAIKLEQSLSKIHGVTWVSLNFATSKVWFEYEPAEVTCEHILSSIEKAGYQYSEPEVTSVHTHITTSTFLLEGVDCPDCATKLQKKISMLDGVDDVHINFSASTMKVKHEVGTINRADILTSVEEVGSKATITEGKGPVKTARFFSLSNKRLLSTIFSGSFILIAIGTYLLENSVSSYSLQIGSYSLTLINIVHLLAIISGGYYVAKSGYHSLLAKTFDMNFLMSAAVIGALAIGEYAEGAIVVFLFSLGNTLQTYTMDKARNAIRLLMDLAPKEAHLKKGGRLLKVPVSELNVGDIIVVKPGEKVSVDGSIINGTTTIDESPITGESKPADKLPGDRVFAGSINGSGSLEVTLEKLADDSTLSRIIHLVEEAQAQKAPSQNFVDSFSKFYTPLVLAGALLITVVPPLLFSLPFTECFYRGLMLLVISCPCALVISTPISIVSAIACASRRGVLVKGGAYLEEMGAINAIAFDKTGTLTKSQFEVTDIVAFNGNSEKDILSIAGSLEMKSEHPLAKAVLKKAQQENVSLIEPEEFAPHPGRGIKGVINGQSAYLGNLSFLQGEGIATSCFDKEMQRLENEGKTTIALHLNSTNGIIALADTPREEAKTCIANLKKNGIKHIVMLTGDNERVADAISKHLNVDEFKSSLLPEEKVDAVKGLLSHYKSVAMVGDGVNDAPALAVSSVGIAMGAAGTDTALETADIALMSDDLLKLPFLVHLSRKTLSTIKTNIVFSLIVKAVFIGIVFLGRANLWMAVVADMGTSLAVILYGMRLITTGGRKDEGTTRYTGKGHEAPLSDYGEDNHHLETLPESSCACGEEHHHDDERHGDGTLR
jgi:Cd2+/Zn2+-exporting ATPase